MTRPREVLPPDKAAHLPLFGRDPLHDDDVAVLCTPEFHFDPRFLNDEQEQERFACRASSILALTGLMGLRDTAIAALRLRDYDPVYGTVRTKVRRAELVLPASPAVRRLLDRWLACRPNDKGDALLCSEHGDPNHSSIGQFMRHLGWRLGTQRQLSTLLAEYFRANLAKGGPDAYKRYWGLKPSKDEPAAPTGNALRTLAKKIDPFGDDIDFLDEPAALQAVVGRGKTRLQTAAHLDVHCKAGMRLADDHPLVVALRASAEKTGHERWDALDALFITFASTIDEVVATKQTTMFALWTLADLDHRVFKERLEAGRQGRAPETRKKKAKPKHEAPPPVLAEGETRRLAAIAATVWKGSKDDFRRKLLKEHFPFVRRLLADKKIDFKLPRKLFKLTAKGVTLRCFDFDKGTLHLATGPRPDLDARREARALAAHARRQHPKMGLTELWKKLRVDYHYPMDYANFAGVIRSFDAGKHKRVGGISAPMPWRYRQHRPRPAF